MHTALIRAVISASIQTGSSSRASVLKNAFEYIVEDGANFLVVLAQMILQKNSCCIECWAYF